jgi:hypothetical protein
MVPVLRIHVWFFFQPTDEFACPWQSYVNIVDPEEAVAGLGVVWTVNEGCSWAPHSWKQSKTVPSVSRICPK